jgi:hypothetical protein
MYAQQDTYAKVTKGEKNTPRPSESLMGQLCDKVENLQLGVAPRLEFIHQNWLRNWRNLTKALESAGEGREPLEDDLENILDAIETQWAEELLAMLQTSMKRTEELKSAATEMLQAIRRNKDAL